MPDFIWITASKGGKCVMCQCDVKVGDRALWSLVNKQQIWCQGCATKMGFADNKGRASAEASPTTEATQRQSRENDIKQAHKENIEASTALFNATTSLSVTLSQLVDVLKQINYQLTVRP